jgi:hypothetical protein
MVPGAGVEPAQCFHRGILSPLRLPISPSGQDAHTDKTLANKLKLAALSS